MAQPDHVAEAGIRQGRPRAAEPAPSRQLPAFLAATPHAFSSNDNHSHFLDHGPADELDCLRRTLAPELLKAAETRARELGIGADQVLIRQGVIDEASYLQHLSHHTGIALDDLSFLDRQHVPLRDDQIPYAAITGIIPMRDNGRLIWAIAPRGLTARAISRLAAEHPDVTPNIRMAPAASMLQFLTRQSGAALGRIAALGLHDACPMMSAAPAIRRGGPWQGRLRRGGAVAAAAALPPIVMPDVFTSLLALWFIGFASLRFAGAVWHRPRLRQRPMAPDRWLPTYSIIAALYREASSVAPLMQAIEALDYPREKLDVLLVVEPDDLATRAAIARLGPMPHVQLLVAPARGPQTKPKALNWALPFVRGSFVAVFDAEDRPEPGQLRAALDNFRDGGEKIACAQASLCIDNETHSWLSRMFATEYAGQFDVVLPGLSAMQLPLPLGGSSNHFRTHVLREVGGWDAYNVTEDADLGFRLARRGYRSVTFSSTTFEEAPIRFGSWLRQRSRWMKGWLQTWCVHMRRPRKLWRDLGPGGFVAINLVAGGNLLTAMACPLLFYLLLTDALSEKTTAWPWLHFTAITTACASTITVGLMGLSRRHRLREAWILVLTPLYWSCLSIAAWRAVLHYVWNPYHWEKTEHGVAKRRNAAAVSRGRPARRSHI
ncbi:MAG: glycosyl transferase, family 2 [Tardiphaga sp.]|nr:glycosyl transferase, family 2 [Tardiphaga sp.]